MSTTVSGITAASFTATGAITGASVKIGTSGTALAKVIKGTISVTIAADATAAEEDISLTVAGLGTTDCIVITPLNASMETGVGIIAAWCSVAGTMKVRISNFHTSSLSGSTALWNYCIIQS